MGNCELDAARVLFANSPGPKHSICRVRTAHLTDIYVGCALRTYGLRIGCSPVLVANYSQAISR
jgi:hypothetical protein